MASECDQVREFLEKHKLSFYYQAFIDQGYDDVDQIMDIAKSTEEMTNLLQDVGMFDKPGHRKRFIAATQIMLSKMEHGEPGPSKQSNEALEDKVQHSSHFSQWPKEVKDLWIPNPLTAKEKFYNKVLGDVYMSSYELMNPQQFKDYAISQRISRWKMEKEVTEIEQTIKNCTNAESKDGRAQNVVHFSAVNMSGQIKKGDSSRAEASYKTVQRCLESTQNLLKKVNGTRAGLFNAEMQVKVWRSGELKYIDSKKEVLEQLVRSLEGTQSAIITNINLLKRKISTDADNYAEKKRKQRRVKENARKSEREKKARRQRKVDQVFQSLTGENETARSLKYKEQKISLSKINKNCKLVPRYHCSALTDLCQMDIFAPDAVSYLKGLSEKMEIHLTNVYKAREKRIKQMAAKKCEKTKFESYFAVEKKEGETEKEIVIWESSCDSSGSDTSETD